MDTKRTFQNLVNYWGEKTPNREAIFDGSSRISYRELNEDIELLTRCLASNIQKGDRILVILPNWYENIVLLFALAKLGAIVIPCNSATCEKELAVRMKITKPKMVFSDKIHFPWLQTFKESCPIITTRFIEDDYLSFSDLLDRGRNIRDYKERLINDDDVFVIMFTSGTTGCPKGAELTYRNLLHSAINIGYRLKCSDKEVFLVPLPCCHMFGIITGVLLPIYFGGKIILMEKFNAQQSLSLIEEEKATILYGVPTMFIRILEEIRNKSRDVSSVRTGIIAGAYCQESLIKQIFVELHCDIMVAYGSTETVSVSMTSFEDKIEKRFQTVGRPFKGIEIKVVNESGDTVTEGMTGELVCKGYGVMKGYYNRPNETKKVLDANGWFHTGDLVTVDKQGFIKIVGRKKDMIIRGGNNVIPAEVEEVYYQHPSVSDVCVLGIPDQELGEQVYAYISLKENVCEREKSLRDYAVGKLAKYKVPDHLIILDEMPKLENGKIDKKFLLEIMVNRKV